MRHAGRGGSEVAGAKLDDFIADLQGEYALQYEKAVDLIPVDVKRGPDEIIDMSDQKVELATRQAAFLDAHDVEHRGRAEEDDAGDDPLGRFLLAFVARNSGFLCVWVLRACREL